MSTKAEELAKLLYLRRFGSLDDGTIYDRADCEDDIDAVLQALETPDEAMVKAFWEANGLGNLVTDPAAVERCKSAWSAAVRAAREEP